jgi:hypothetical protein
VTLFVFISTQISFDSGSSRQVELKEIIDFHAVAEILWFYTPGRKSSYCESSPFCNQKRVVFTLLPQALVFLMKTYNIFLSHFSAGRKWVPPAVLV